MKGSRLRCCQKRVPPERTHQQCTLLVYSVSSKNECSVNLPPKRCQRLNDRMQCKAQKLRLNRDLVSVALSSLRFLRSCPANVSVGKSSVSLTYLTAIMSSLKF
jgi:hypothetical protein